MIWTEFIKETSAGKLIALAVARSIRRMKRGPLNRKQFILLAMALVVLGKIAHIEKVPIDEVEDTLLDYWDGID